MKDKGIIFVMFLLLLVFIVPGQSVYANTEAQIESFSIEGPKYYNNTQTINASATTANLPLYKFIVRDMSNGKWKTIQEYSESTSITWTPQQVGRYQIGVHIKDIDSEQWLDSDQYMYINYGDIPVSKISSLTTTGENIVHSNITVSATANGDENLYKFIVKNSAHGSWYTIQEYSSIDTVNWSPEETGEYQIGVHVKNKYSRNWLDSDMYKKVQIVSLPKAQIKSINISGRNYLGSNLVISGESKSVNNAMYKFLVRHSSDTRWTTLQNYSYNNQINWIPEKSGTYQFGIHVKDENSSNWLDSDSYTSKTFFAPPLSKVTLLETSKPSYEREEVLINADATGMNAVQFKFLVRDMKDGNWITLQDYSNESSIEWLPDETGSYQVGVHVKDEYSSNWMDSEKYTYIDIGSLPKANITDLKIFGENHVGSSQTIEVKGNSINKPLYKFLVRNVSEGKWLTLQDYSFSNKINWVPQKAGSYQIGVHIKDEKSIHWLDSDKYIHTSYIAPPLAKLSSLDVSGPDYIGGKQKITAAGFSVNAALYKFLVRNIDDGKWITIQDYSEKKQVEWIPENSSKYQYGVHIKDLYSENWLDNDMYSVKNYTSPPNATIDSFTISGDNYSGSNQEITVQSFSVNEPLYKFVARNYVNGKWSSWITINTYSTSNKINWQPESPGRYQIGVHVKDKYSNNWLDSDKYIFKDFLGTLIYKNSYFETTLTGALSKQMLKKPQTDLYGPDIYGNTWQDATSNDVEFYLNPLSFMTQTESTSNRIRITASILNVRTGYNVSYPIIGSALLNDIYDVISEQNGWYKIRFNNDVGWVSGSYTELIPENKSIQSFQSSMYQFMDISSISGLTSTMINNELIGKGVLENKGLTFLEAAIQFRISEIYLLAHVLLETGNGTSTLSNGILVNSVDSELVEPKMVYNLFGIGAVDGSAIRSGSEYAYKQGWFSVDEAIYGGVKWISENYVHHTTYRQNTIYKMRWNPNNPGVHQYATDIGWSLKQTRNMGLVLEIAQRNNMPVLFDIPVYQK